MSLNRISKLERIEILADLVEKYCGNSNIVDTIHLAKDLATVIDELNYSGISLSKLSEDFMIFFPEHWKKRTQFLMIVSKYWPEILKEMNLKDVENSRGRGVVQLSSIPHRAPSDTIFHKISILTSESIYDEIDSVIEIIKRHPQNRISIISPDRDFSRYLTMRLNFERIRYFSYVNNCNPSESFIESIKKKFENCSETELKKIINELSEMEEIEEFPSDILIRHPRDIDKIQKGEIVIYTELNEASWKLREAGRFWLHHSIRKNFGLLANPTVIEGLFYLGIEKSSKTYLFRSQKSCGQSNKKSSILAKFEAIAKKNGIPLRTVSSTAPISQPKTSDLTINREHFKLPHDINVRDIELLMREPLAFYARQVLDLKPVDFDIKKHDIIVAFRNIAKNHFNKQPIDPWLDVLKSVDFFAYQKAIGLIDFFEKHCQNQNSQNDLVGKMELQQFGLCIYGYADRVIESENSAILISYQSANSQSTKDIIYGNSSAVLLNCLIAEKKGFSQIKNPIRKIQTWNLVAAEESQIITKEIEISKEILDSFEERLISNLKNYLDNPDFEIGCNPRQKQLYNKYRHFKRI